jgi:hypothetical protein
VSTPTTASGRTLENVDFEDFMTVFEQFIITEDGMFTSSSVKAASYTHQTLFYLMTLTNKHSDMSAFFDLDTLSRSASTVYGNVYVQIMSKDLRQPANQSTDMSISWVEQRLQVRLLNVWMMGSSLVVLKCLTLLIMMLCPTNVVAQDPSTLAGLATICASSENLNIELKDQRHVSNRLLRRRLRGNRFRSSKERIGKSWDFLVKAVASDHPPLRLN